MATRATAAGGGWETFWDRFADFGGGTGALLFSLDDPRHAIAELEAAADYLEARYSTGGAG